jgi:hypothetical protein
MFFVELEPNDMRVLGAIKRGANSVRFLKNIVNVKSDEIEKVLDVLDESGLIRSEYRTGLLGQSKLVIQITDSGIKGEKCLIWQWLVRERLLMK